jgi:lysophospholipase L1-like esterase
MSTRGYLPKLVLAVISILLTLLLLEIGFRIGVHFENQGLLRGSLDPGIEIPSDRRVGLGHMIRMSRNPRIIYELKPHLSVIYEGAPVTTNSQGFRSPEMAPRRNNSLRLVGIGDSFMFGQGVDDNEPYLQVLARRLQAQPEPPRWEVASLAVPGYNTVMEVESFKEKGLPLTPSLVVIEFVGNDLSVPNFVHSPRPVLSVRRSFLVDFVRWRTRIDWNKTLWRKLQVAGLQAIVIEDPEGLAQVIDPELVPPQYRHLVGWQAYRGALEELQMLAAVHGFRVLWISLAAHEGGLKEQARLIADKLGMLTLDVGPVFRRYLDRYGYGRYLGSPLSASDEDGHPSVLGHRLAGEAIFHFLEENLLLHGAPVATPGGAAGGGCG